MENKVNDEIDLQELGVRIIRYFKRHLRFIVISMFLGTGVGAVSWVLLPPVYESEMILTSDILNESYSERITQTINRLIREQNNVTIAAKLNLTLEEAEKIKSIGIESVKKPVNVEKGEKGEKDEATIFIVTVEITEEKILTKLQEGLISFLRNNEFVKIRVLQREIYYKALITKLDEEIRSLDSLKRRLFIGKPIYADRSEMLLVDPTSIYSKIIDLNRLRIEYINSLELINSIELVEGFTLFEKPRSPKLSVLLVAGFGLGLMIAVFLLTLMHLIKLARKDDD